VTAKGRSTAQDRLWTFRYSLMWAVVPVVIMTIAFMRHRPYPMMMAWTAIILFVCLAPIFIWLYDRSRSRSRSPGDPGGRHAVSILPEDPAALDLASEKA
jgi:membrane protein YdbS with pleckstrin-like domain